MHLHDRARGAERGPLPFATPETPLSSSCSQDGHSESSKVLAVCFRGARPCTFEGGTGPPGGELGPSCRGPATPPPGQPATRQSHPGVSAARGLGPQQWLTYLARVARPQGAVPQESRTAPQAFSSRWPCSSAVGDRRGRMPPRQPKFRNRPGWRQYGASPQVPPAVGRGCHRPARHPHSGWTASSRTKAGT